MIVPQNRAARRLAGALAVIGVLAAEAVAESTVTLSDVRPHIQQFAYPTGSGNGAGGVRDRAAVFASYSGIDEQTMQPVLLSGDGVGNLSRRASFVLASNTADDVPVGLDPSRYRIDSIKITVSLVGTLIFNDFGIHLPYDNTLDSSLSLTTGGGDDPGHPVELYGIGFREGGDYETLSFDPLDGAENAFRLGDVRWRPFHPEEDGYDPQEPEAWSPYQYFALDANGDDAENAVFGGYSATEPGNHTEQFTPTPLAIGKVYDPTTGQELAAGAHLNQRINGAPDDFVFEPDLSNPGVVSYLQQTLAAGYVGFTVSALHEPDGRNGSVPYPDFYLDDLTEGDNPDGPGPEIELTVTILDELLPGDFDGSGHVDTQDYLLWKSQFGGGGPDADGNADGIVDIADLTIWRDNLGAGVPPQLAVAVPEPSSAQCLWVLGLTACFCGWANWFTLPRSRRSQR